MGHPCSNQAELSPVTSSEPANSCFPPLEGSLSMMVAAKSLQIYIPLPSAQPSLPLCGALTLSTQVPATLSILGHPVPRKSSPYVPRALGHVFSEGSTSPPAWAGCVAQLSSGSLGPRNKRLLENSS